MYAGEKIKKFFKGNYCYFISAGVVLIVMLIVAITEKIAPFGNRSLSIVDSLHQYLPFFSEYRNKLLSGGSPFYTWNVAMGQNFMVLSSYYLASPFNLIFLFFKKEGMAAGFTVICIIKIMLSAVTMTHFLSYKDGRKSNNIHIIAISVSYALSNYIISYYWNIMWLDCILIFPLIMLGFIRLMENKDPKMYALSLCYALYCNYYIGFIICVFLVIWFFLYNHWKADNNFDSTQKPIRRVISGFLKHLKKFFFNGLRFAIFSLISGGMAAFMLIPAYKGIMLTASAKAEFPKWELYGSYFEILKQQLFMTKPITNQTFDGGVNLYCGMLAVFAFFMYVLSGKIALFDKIRNVLLLALLMVSFNSVPLNFIWHGFHNQYGIPNRFSFLYIFVILVMAYDVLKKTKHIKGYQVILSGLAAVGFVCLCNAKAEVSSRIFVASVTAVIIYTIVCMLKAFKVYKGRVFHAVITGLCLLEICVSAILGFYDNGYASYAKYYDTTSNITAANKEIDIMEADGSSGFYRRELMDSTVLDEVSWHNMPSIGVFCSTVMGNMTKFMGRVGFYTGANEFLYMGATPFTNSIFNVRYLLYREGDLNNFDFDYVKTVENVGIYKNPYPLSIGFAVRKNVKEFNVENSMPLKNQNSLATLMTGYGSLYNDVVPEFSAASDTCELSVNGNVIKCKASETGKNGFIVSFTIESDGDYYINCRGNYVTKIRFYINGEEYAYDRYQLQIFHLGELKKGDCVSVEYCYDNLEAGEHNASIYMATLNKEAFELTYAELADNMLSVSYYDDRHIRGTIDMPEGEMLFTSIPYDEGWEVYVDGKKTPYYALGGALIGVDMTAGRHEIEMVYVPQGLYMGIWISVISWLLFFAVLYKKRTEFNANDIDRSSNL